MCRNQQGRAPTPVDFEAGINKVVTSCWMTRHQVPRGRDLPPDDERASAARSRSSAGRRKSQLRWVAIFRRTTKKSAPLGRDLPLDDETSNSARSRSSAGRRKSKRREVAIFRWMTSSQTQQGRDPYLVDLRSNSTRSRPCGGRLQIDSTGSRPCSGRLQIKIDRVVTLWWSTSDRFDRVTTL